MIDRITNGIAKVTWNDGFGNRRFLPLEFVYPNSTQPLCYDNMNWEDSSSYGCSVYASLWCGGATQENDGSYSGNGEVTDSRYAGMGAEENCCACGKQPDPPGEKRAFYL